MTKKPQQILSHLSEKDERVLVERMMGQLADSVLDLSDEEVLAEARDVGRVPEEEAEITRSVLQRALKERVPAAGNFEPALAGLASPTTVLIGENTRIHSQLLAEALRRDPRIHVVGAVSSAQEFLSLAAQKMPHVVLISTALDEDPSCGLLTLREFHSAQPQTPAVVLLESCKRELVLEAFRSGARGIFSKNDSTEALCKCVLSVHAGQVWANSREIRYAIDALCTSPAVRAVNTQGTNLLSPRELELVQYLADGLTNRAIGAQMKLSPHTVKNYLLRIFDKLGVSNRIELLSLTLGRSSTASSGTSQPLPPRYRSKAHQRVEQWLPGTTEVSSGQGSQRLPAKRSHEQLLPERGGKT